MRVPAIWSPRTGRQCDTHLPALWSPLWSAPNTLPDVGTNHSVWALFFFSICLYPFFSALPFSPPYISLHLASRKSLPPAARPFPFRSDVRQDSRVLHFGPSAQGSAGGRSPAGTARGSAPASLCFRWTMPPARAAKALSVERMALDLLEQDGPDSAWRQ